MTVQNSEHLVVNEFNLEASMIYLVYILADTSSILIGQEMSLKFREQLRIFKLVRPYCFHSNWELTGKHLEDATHHWVQGGSSHKSHKDFTDTCYASWYMFPDDFSSLTLKAFRTVFNVYEMNLDFLLIGQTQCATLTTVKRSVC